MVMSDVNFHNAIWHRPGDRLYIIAQAWTPGHYFVPAQV